MQNLNQVNNCLDQIESSQPMRRPRQGINRFARSEYQGQLSYTESKFAKDSESPTNNLFVSKFNTEKRKTNKFVNKITDKTPISMMPPAVSAISESI